MEALAEARQDILFHYSPYSFLPKINSEKVFSHSILNKLEEGLKDPDTTFFEVKISNQLHVFVLKFLKWDSDYFNIKTYRLQYVLYKHNDYSILKQATQTFVKDFFKTKETYCFSEIPSEDIFTIQALNEAGFKLIETRLTYYLNLTQYAFPERFKVRSATPEDITNLMRVAREMRNKFDRFHAETIFDSTKADEFLATYIEQSIKGFADYTMVPNEASVPSDAFLTANYLKSEWDLIGKKISKMVLSAVSDINCKGWYLKLISEMAYHLKSQGAEFAFMHPASTNRAVIHTYEKLGCKYGKCVNVLTYIS